MSKNVSKINYNDTLLATHWAHREFEITSLTILLIDYRRNKKTEGHLHCVQRRYGLEEFRLS
jgi:hypothetical protein